MINRIKWDVDDDAPDDDDDDKEEDDDDEEEKGAVTKLTLGSGIPGKCVLAWEGTLPRRQFKDFKFELCSSSEAARKYLKTKGCPQYWDLVLNQ